MELGNVQIGADIQSRFNSDHGKSLEYLPTGEGCEESTAIQQRDSSPKTHREAVAQKLYRESCQGLRAAGVNLVNL